MEKSSVDVLWVAASAGLVFLMQAGFLCLESGLTRSKNNINVAMKNLTDFGISTMLFWALGYALMFGLSVGGWIGTTKFVFALDQQAIWPATFFLFQAMFCSTSVTILSGAVAERMRFGAYIFAAALVSSLIYPLFGHWAWNGLDTGAASGWLGVRGFVDFAGSTVVHSVGGWISLAALLVIGPRAGRFPNDGPPRRIPGANLPMAMLGVMLLWFGWFGFNGGSTLAINRLVPIVIVNTVIAGAAGMVVTLAIGWLLRGRPDVDLVINGSLAGLVSITASCFAVTTMSAIIIGSIGGMVMLGVDRLLERLRIDDAVGAIPVHLGAGIWGTLAVGLFGQAELLAGSPGRWAQIQAQLEGIVVCGLWTFGVAFSALTIANRFFPLRITPEQEHIGLNVSEHGASTEIVDLLTVMERQVASGDLSLRVPVEPFTEVGQIADRYNQVLQALDQAIARTRAIVGSARDGILTFAKHDFSIISLNPAAETLFGYPEAQLIGQPISVLLESSGNERSSAPLRASIALADGLPHELTGQRRDGSAFPLEVVLAEAAGQGTFLVGTFRDISERRRIEEARARIQEQLIEAQAATLAELSTPLIPITDQTLVMPLIGAVDSQRAQHVFDTLLRGVERSRARTVILDITGVPIIDAQVAGVLLQIAQGTRLLGAQMLLTGIRPDVAETLIGLGVDLQGIVTYGTLQDGVAATLRQQSSALSTR
jgi:Amt family ammonium transporter